MNLGMCVKKLLFYCALIKLCVATVNGSSTENAKTSAAKKLMKQIFETEDYNPAVRPVLNSTTPTDIVLDLAIQQIINVDVKKEQITVLYWQRMEWVDEFLRWDPFEMDYENLTEITVLPKDVWLPDIVVFNNVRTFKMEKNGIVPVSITHNGTVKWYFPIIYVTTCTMHIRHFPYDAQVCDVKFGPWINTASTITVKNTRGTLDTKHFSLNGEWILQNTQVSNNRTVYDGVAYTDVLTKLYIVRRELFYETNLIIPTAIISLLAILTFVLPPESGEKIELAITVFLSLCVNLLVISDMMPSTSLEMPILGQYYLMSIIMVAVSLAMTVVVLNFHFPHANARPPPKWVKKVFYKYLSRLVFLSRVKTNEYESRNLKDGEIPLQTRTRKDPARISRSGDWVAVDNGRVNEHSNGDAAEKTDLQPVDSVEQKIDKLMERFVGNHEDANVVQEWRYITRIIDRLFAIAFFLITAFLTVTLIMNAKMVDLNNL